MFAALFPLSAETFWILRLPNCYFDLPSLSITLAAIRKGKGRLGLVWEPDGTGPSGLPSLLPLPLAGTADQAGIGIQSWPSLHDCQFRSTGAWLFSFSLRRFVNSVCLETNFIPSSNYSQAGTSQQTHSSPVCTGVDRMNGETWGNGTPFAGICKQLWSCGTSRYR